MKDVDPGLITQIEYSNTIGISGATSTIIINPQMEKFDYRGITNKCERPITSAEWNSLVEGFNWKEFKKSKSITESVCCDLGGGGLKVTMESASHEVTWTQPLPKGVQVELIRKLSERWGNLGRTCR